jgi:hypothetical protein
MDTERLLKDLSYDFYKHVQKADKPEEENLTFSDIFLRYQGQKGAI